MFLSKIGHFFVALFGWFHSKQAKAIGEKIAEYAQDVLPLSQALAAAGFVPAKVATVFLQFGIKYAGELQNDTLLDDVKSVINKTLLRYVMDKYHVNETAATLVYNSAYLAVQHAEGK